MANFKTHITTSSLIGVGLGAGGWLGMGIPLDHCLIAGGLCGVSGMLPDLDSPNSVPVRETVALSAALIPALMIRRFEHIGLTHEQIVVVCGLLYFGIRFGIAAIFKRYTVHRGMWHSIPAALTASLLALMISSCDFLEYRLFNAIAVFIGFISHLVLDEIYSIDLSGAKIRVKKSSGTALKFWSGNSWANFSTYAKLAAVAFVLTFDPMIMNAIGTQPMQVPEAARVWLSKFSRPAMRRPHDEHNHRRESIPHAEQVDAEMNPAVDTAPRFVAQPEAKPVPLQTVPQFERPREVLPMERWPLLEQGRSLDSSQQIR